MKRKTVLIFVASLIIGSTCYFLIAGVVRKLFLRKKKKIQFLKSEGKIVNADKKLNLRDCDMNTATTMLMTEPIIKPQKATIQQSLQTLTPDEQKNLENAIPVPMPNIKVTEETVTMVFPSIKDCKSF